MGSELFFLAALVGLVIAAMILAARITGQLLAELVRVNKGLLEVARILQEEEEGEEGAPDDLPAPLGLLPRMGTRPRLDPGALGVPLDPDEEEPETWPRWVV
jgi:hypothetical protein